MGRVTWGFSLRAPLPLCKIEWGRAEPPGRQVPWLFTPSHHLHLLEVPAALSKADLLTASQPLSGVSGALQGL